jgi:heterotetrameric sarcosine oxidase gamma subunit
MAELAAWPIIEGRAVSWESAAIAARRCEGLGLLRVKFLESRAAGAEALGLPASGDATVGALGIAPCDWLLFHPESEHEACAARVRDAGGYAVDLSDALIVLDLDGAAETVSRLTGIDRARFAQGKAARTRLAGIAVVLTGMGEGDVRMIFDRSYAHHLRRYWDVAL